MSVLHRLLPERRDAVTDELTQRRRIGTAAGEPVTFDTSLRHFAVWSCVNLIADLAAHLPMSQYRRTPDGGRIQVEPSPLLTSPASDVTANEWRRQLLVSALLRGNAWGIVTEQDRRLGLPLRIETVHPDTVTARRAGKFSGFEVRYNGVTLGPGEYFHLPAYLNPGSPVGLSPIAYAAQAIGLGRAAEKFGGEWFADGVHPSGMLTNPNDIGDTDGTISATVKARFIDSVRGREPAVLAGGWAYDSMRIPANESQFLETYATNGGVIAAYYGLRPEDIGLAVSGSSVTYANVEQRNITRLTYPLAQWLERLEARLNWALPPGEFVKAKVAALLRVDLKTRYEAHQIAIQNGFMNRDETRALEELPPIPGGAGAVFDTPAAPSFKETIDAAAALVRSGYSPQAALKAVGLDPMEHTGLLPTTLARPAER